ncbi:RAD9 checkpoint clamp component B [Nothobranchius furzeri]|uniref:Cell cycle checkpoint control protein RAD9A n=1 Tax=Nothobranchius furzeri TaxID=105023 RepID=A0A9D2XC30_NOTFU|nr:RAD9 checkpoint clamp component B [Nothobranchius furzeri]
MNCVIEGNCIKVFGKALHALSRIGDEVWLDPMVKGLALRSVNSAQSAYGCFLFLPVFFQQYSLGSFSEQNRKEIKCKMVMKVIVLPLFRCLSSIEQCHISVNTSPDQVIIQFFCRHDITKTHNLGFQESGALQAVFDAHLCPNVLTAPARLLSDMVMHFSAFQEEVTLSMTPLKVCLRNYHEERNGELRLCCALLLHKHRSCATVHTKVMHTEMSLHPDEFGYFQSGEDSDITFCLKELRGILAFAEARSLPVSVHFGAAGRPVCFSVQDMILEATVILATLTDTESQTPSQHPQTPTSTPPR